MIRLRSEHLAVARHATGLHKTTADLAKAMGMAPSTVSRILNGQREVSADFMNGMKRAFPDMPWEYLFEGVDDERAIAS